MSEASAISQLPERVQQKLQELQQRLQRALGDGLDALLVFGSAARGGYQEGISDVDVLIVLNDDGPETLTAIAEAVRQARYAARIEAMILTSAEIPRAADVFPLFYDDIRQRHAVLYGKDPFAGLAISDEHRRLRIEQELREIQIRMRRAVTDSAGPDQLRGLLRRKLRQLRGPLHALLKRRGYGTPDDLGSVLRALASRYDLDLAPLLGEPSPQEALETLHRLLRAAIHDIDQEGSP